MASPHIYVLYTEMIMRAINELDGFKIASKVGNNLRYADDTAVLAE